MKELSYATTLSKSLHSIRFLQPNPQYNIRKLNQAPVAWGVSLLAADFSNHHRLSRPIPFIYKGQDAMFLVLCSCCLPDDKFFGEINQRYASQQLTPEDVAVIKAMGEN